MTMGRFVLQKSTECPDKWVFTDAVNGIVLTFTEGDFNDSQKITMLHDDVTHDPLALARIVGEGADWMREHHSEILFSSPAKIKQAARAIVGKTLRELRESAGVSQWALAKMTGLTQGNIARVEAGKYNVTLDTLALIANALDCNINFCIDDPDSLPNGEL